MPPNPNENCLFCKIVPKQIPSTITYEDDLLLAFLDIHPVTHGHTLLIPKEHYAWVHETPDELISSAFIKAKELIKRMRNDIPCDYVEISVIGKDVPHFHIHLIPRKLDK